MYEQARWAILLEEIECTEEEMLMFASLQVTYYYTLLAKGIVLVPGISLKNDYKHNGLFIALTLIFSQAVRIYVVYM